MSVLYPYTANPLGSLFANITELETSTVVALAYIAAPHVSAVFSSNKVFEMDNLPFLSLFEVPTI